MWCGPLFVVVATYTVTTMLLIKKFSIPASSSTQFSHHHRLDERDVNEVPVQFRPYSMEGSTVGNFVDDDQTVETIFSWIRELPGGENPWIAINWVVVGALGLVIAQVAMLRVVLRILKFVVLFVGRVVFRAVGLVNQGLRRTWTGIERLRRTRPATGPGRDWSSKFDLPNFSNQLNFRLWRQLFCICSAHHNNPRELLLAKLDGFVRAQLDAAFLRKQPKTALSLLLDYLDCHFGQDVGVQHDNMRAFTECQQDANEQCIDYVCRLRLFATQAFPDRSDHEIDFMVRDRFIRYVSNYSLAAQLVTIVSQNEKASLLELVNIALMGEHALRASSRISNINSMSTISTTATNVPNASTTTTIISSPLTTVTPNASTKNSTISTPIQTWSAPTTSTTSTTTTLPTSNAFTPSTSHLNSTLSNPSMLNSTPSISSMLNSTTLNTSVSSMTTTASQQQLPPASQPQPSVHQPISSAISITQNNKGDKKPSGKMYAVKVNGKRIRRRWTGAKQPKSTIPRPILGLCRLNGEVVEFQLDPGADLSLIDADVYRQLKPAPQLKPSAFEFETADRRVMDILGQVELVWQLGKREMVVQVHVAKQLGRSFLIGRELIESNPDLKEAMSSIQSIVSSLSVRQQQPLPSAKINNIEVTESIEKVTAAEIEEIRARVREMIAPVSASTIDDLRPLTSTDNHLTHAIELIDPEKQPVRERARRVPPSKVTEFSKLLKEMIDGNLIQPCSSSWSSPVLLVPKKDGSIRLTIDYRKLNDRTKKDAYPLPHHDDLFAKLANAKWYSKLDLFSGYYQIRMDEKSRPMTAFACPDGLFEYVVMPMGLTNAPATFQRTMTSILQDGIRDGFIVVFIDDILVFSKTLEEHERHMKWLTDTLAKYSLKLKSSKCELVQEEVEFLGHKIERGCLRPLKPKLEAIENMPRPTTITELRRFLGMAQYYRKFVRDFSVLAAPLFQLTSQPKNQADAPITWSDRAEQAFTAIKKALVSDNVLTLPNFSKPFFLDTDASDYGVGAVLEQEVDGVRKPIGYFSKHLSPAQKRYSALERELLAIVLAIEHFHFYILGNELTVYSDHQPLSWVKSAQKLNSRVARWLVRLNIYDFKIVYRKGSLNQKADALSRATAPLEAAEVGDADVDDEELPAPIINHVRVRIQVHNNRARLKIVSDQVDVDQPTKGQLTDPDIIWIRELLENHDIRPDITHFDNVVRRELFAAYEKLAVENGVVIYHDEDSMGLSRRRIVLAKDDVEPTIRLVHGSLLGGHLGIQRTIEQVLERAFRPGLRKEITRFVTECHTCQVAKTSGKTPRAELHPLKAQQPCELITSDIIGPLHPTPRGNKYIIVICDHFSKWTQAYPLVTTTAEDVAKIVLEHMYRFGLATNILTDQGRNYQANLLSQLYDLLDIHKLRTSPYHPECNGITERFNRSLKTMLRCFVDENQDNWDELLSALCFAYNSSVHTATKMAPFEIIYGRKPKIPLDLIVGDLLAIDQDGMVRERSTLGDMESDEDDQLMRALAASSSPAEYEEFVTQLKTRMAMIAKYVVNNNDVKMSKAKITYDRKLTPLRYEVGDLVLRADKTGAVGMSKKLKMPWTGPYRVIECVSDVTYKIKMVTSPGQKQKRAVIVHHNNLKRYYPSSNRIDKIVESTDLDVTEVLVNSGAATASSSPTSNSNAGNHARRRGRPQKSAVVQQQQQNSANLQTNDHVEARADEQAANDSPYVPPRHVTFAEPTVEIRRGTRDRRPTVRFDAGLSN